MSPDTLRSDVDNNKVSFKHDPFLHFCKSSFVFSQSVKSCGDVGMFNRTLDGFRNPAFLGKQFHPSQLLFCLQKILNAWTNITSSHLHSVVFLCNFCSRKIPPTFCVFCLKIHTRWAPKTSYEWSYFTLMKMAEIQMAFDWGNFSPL